MSREIKFRVWIKGKIFGYERIGKNGWEAMCPELNPDKGERWTPGVMTNMGDKRDQFVGHKDKKGVEVYEGDILLADNNQKYIVVWIDQICGFYLSLPNTRRGKEFISCAASQSDGPITLDTHEVVGNIYQNP